MPFDRESDFFYLLVGVFCSGELMADNDCG